MRKGSLARSRHPGICIFVSKTPFPVAGGNTQPRRSSVDSKPLDRRRGTPTLHHGPSNRAPGSRTSALNFPRIAEPELVETESPALDHLPRGISPLSTTYIFYKPTHHRGTGWRTPISLGASGKVPHWAHEPGASMNVAVRRVWLEQQFVDRECPGTSLSPFWDRAGARGAPQPLGFSGLLFCCLMPISPSHGPSISPYRKPISSNRTLHAAWNYQ
jgi:hypothetical protein